MLVLLFGPFICLYRILMDFIHKGVELLLRVLVSTAALIVEGIYYVLAGLSWITNKLYLLEIVLVVTLLYLVNLTTSI